MERIWSMERAAAVLDVELVGFDSEGHVPAGAHGWSKFCTTRGRAVMAINPDTHLPPDLIAFHELAHIVLEHSKMPAALKAYQYADCEIQAMKVALVLGEELLGDSADEWRAEAEDYIAGYTPDRYCPETVYERRKIAEAIDVIRAAGMASELVAA